LNSDDDIGTDPTIPEASDSATIVEAAESLLESISSASSEAYDLRLRTNSKSIREVTYIDSRRFRGQLLNGSFEMYII
jgi:hypothetical protein